MQTKNITGLYLKEGRSNYQVKREVSRAREKRKMAAVVQRPDNFIKWTTSDYPEYKIYLTLNVDQDVLTHHFF